MRIAAVTGVTWAPKTKTPGTWQNIPLCEHAKGYYMWIYIYIYGNVVVICSNMVIIVEAGSRGLFLCAAFG